MARNGSPRFAESPENTGYRSPTRARKIVTALTELPERFIEYVDDNVAVSKGNESVLKGERSLTAPRSTSGFSHKGHHRPRSRLLDKNGSDPDGAIGWSSFIIFPKGLCSCCRWSDPLLMGSWCKGDAYRRWRRQFTRRNGLYDSHLPSYA